MNANWILNTDESIYHLKLRQEHVAENIITVGDPERVPMISNYFDTIEFKISSREFVTHTGFFKNKRITVISTGIGTDNVEIVLNEIDALFNVNFLTGQDMSPLKSLNIIRLGTSGAIQEEIPVDTLLISNAAIGVDALMDFYVSKNQAEESEILKHFMANGIQVNSLYYIKVDESLLTHFKDTNIMNGLTLTTPGFYAPQGRTVRIKSHQNQLLSKLSKLDLNPFGKIANIEMETAGIYALATLMGHRSISLNAILANRITNEFSSNPEKTIRKLIEYCLEKIVLLEQ
ncbi:MAG: nucleoside phosphorylase [Saprospiraceae bacterium]